MHLKQPNSMKESERTACRDAFAGYRDGTGVERHLIEGGWHYLSDRFGRYVVIAFIGKAIKLACEGRS